MREEYNIHCRPNCFDRPSDVGSITYLAIAKLGPDHEKSDINRRGKASYVPADRQLALSHCAAERSTVLPSKTSSKPLSLTMVAPPPRLTPISASNSGDPPQRPEPTTLQLPTGQTVLSSETLRPDDPTPQPIPRKKRNHRGGKKKRARRQSFAASTEDGSGMPETPRQAQSQSAARASFYRLQGRNISNTSIESEALLDHR